jgi:uncharacterized protein (TIRG00374 family)
LLWWSAKDLTPDQRAELKHSLAHSKYIFVIPAMFLLLLGHYSRALRWKILMEPLGYNPSTINTFFAVMTGYLFNLFVPRLGEVMKCTILGKYENVPADKLVGTIVAERAFDVICLVLLILLTIFTQVGIIGDYASVQFRHFFMDAAGHFRFKKIITLIAILIAVFLVARWILNKFAHIDFVQKINNIVKGVWLGISSAKYINKKGWFFFHTVFIWLMYLGSVRIGLYAMEPVSHLGFRASLSILTFGSLAMIVTQGGIGAYQLAIQKLMPLYGIGEADGLGFGWVLWAAQTAIVVVIGFLCLFLLPVFNRKKNEAV